MGRYGISRAFMFCLDEPDRHPAFSAANDRTLAFAERCDGRLIPFVRLDLNESPIEEARRCLDPGARGIKLHPRAQSSRATDERLAPVFALAAERRVPILIHGGRGLPPIADGLARARRALPGGDADHRARRHRRPGATSRAAWPAARASSSTPRPGARSTCSTSTARSRPSRSSTRATTPTGSSPTSLLIALQDGAARRVTTTSSCARCSRGTPHALADGEELPEPTRPSAARHARAADAARAHPPVPLDGDAAPLDAPARHDRRARPRDQRLRRARRPRRRRSTASASCSTPRATSGRRCPTIDDEAERRQADAADAPPHPPRRHRGGDRAA